MNDIKKALDSGMKNIHFDESLVLNSDKRHNRRHIVMREITAAIAVIALITVCITTETAQAAFAYVYQSIANITGQNDKVEDYTTIIGKSVTDNGFTVTLSDVIVSEEKQILSINITDGNKLEEFSNLWPSEVKVYMDGIEMPTIAFEGTAQKLDEYTTNNIFECYFGKVDQEEEHEFKITISKITEKKESTNEISGEWTFNFVASGKTMASDTKVNMLDDVLNYKDDSIIFEKFVSNSYENLLYVSYSDGSGYMDRGSEFYLIGHDDLGNELRFYPDVDYYNKQRTVFTSDDLMMISEEASTLTLQVGEWPFEFDEAKQSITINLK